MLLILILINLTLISSLYLTSSQFKTINNLLLHPKLTSYQKNKLDLIIYKSFEKYAIKQANIYKNKHFYKCKNINIDDLIICSKFGLYKSIKKYNPKYPIMDHMKIYIKSEMLGLITYYYSSSIVPRNIRIKNKKNFTLNELELYNKNIDISKINYTNKIVFNENYYSKNNLILDKIKDNEVYENIWKQINNMNPTIKRIASLKYDYNFNIIRSNKDISILMCLSQETIRKKLNYFCDNFKYVEM